MFYIVVAAVLLMSAWMASEYKKNVCDCLALCSAVLIMCLYALAFFRALPCMVFVAAFAVLFICFRGVKESGKEKGAFTTRLKGLTSALSDPVLIMFVLAVAGVSIATSGQVFTWWDDINFWSSDAKQIYFMDGFPGKYGNVSPEFGDYPPVTSLFKWLFLQISLAAYKESLQFAGYFALNCVFLMPLMARIKDYIDEAGFSVIGRLCLTALSFAAVMLFPGIFNGIIYYGTPADVTMAVVYGALLLAIYDSAGHGDTFYFGRIALYACVLLLTKTVAFEWTAFALIFYMFLGKRDRKMIFSVLAAGACLGSWMGFCLINRRVAKLTGAGIKMATSGSFEAPDNTIDKLKFFVQGFLFEPMHTDHNLTLDLSTAAAVALIFIGIFLMYNKNILGRREVRGMAFFAALTALLSYGIVFLAHISIFQTEDQYLDAYAMGISISRYCAPFTMGMSYLLVGILFNRLRALSRKKHRQTALLVLAVLVLLASDYSGVYRHLWGYRKDVSQNEKTYYDMVGDEGRAIVKALDDPSYHGKRVLVFKDGRSFYWVHNAYISKEASPVPLVYGSYDCGEDSKESIKDKIDASHAEYIYVADETGEARELFSGLIREYEAGKVYRISESLY